MLFTSLAPPPSRSSSSQAVVVLPELAAAQGHDMMDESERMIKSLKGTQSWMGIGAALVLLLIALPNGFVGRILYCIEFCFTPGMWRSKLRPKVS